MLPPEYLQGLPAAILELYRDAELQILADMARRLMQYDYWIPAAEHQRKAVQEAGRSQEDILRTLSGITGKSDLEIQKMMQDAGGKTLTSDSAEYEEAGLHPPDIQSSKRLLDILNAGYRATKGTMQNLTRTTAQTASQQFERALDHAWMEIQSGGFDYHTAIRNAVKNLAQQGLQSVRYPTGRTDSLEVAVRRAVVTGVNQTALQLQWDLADEVGCDLVETTAHAGARPSHALWQGQIFSRSGKSSKYPDFRAATGYGTGSGLGGWNCRHSYHPYLGGTSRAYTQEMLDRYNARDYMYSGQTMTEYEVSQIQRYYERKIRQWKREYTAMEAAGLDTTESAAKIQQWQNQLEDLIKQTGLKRQFNRENISGKIFTKVTIPDTIQAVAFDEKQFGKKVGKHAIDFGLSADSPEDRDKMKKIIRNIVDYAEEKVKGSWRGQEGPVWFYIKGADVVVTKENGKFITILKGGADNARVKEARRQ